MLAGLAFKISAVPFHMWTPDVYEGAPTPGHRFLRQRAQGRGDGAADPAGRIGRWARPRSNGARSSSSWRWPRSSSAASRAIGQTNIKRLLAYSSINNVGFALIGLAAATREGVASVLFYMAVYVVMTLGSFLVVLRMRDEAGEPVETIASLSGLSRTRPLLAAAMAMFMFSLAGIPPLIGFWPKFFVFNAAVAGRSRPGWPRSASPPR